MTLYSAQSAPASITINTSQFWQRVSFALLLMTLFSLPLPLGATLSWGWSGLTLTVWCITAATYLLTPQPCALKLRHAWSAMSCWLLIILWQLVQLIPLPDELIRYTLNGTLLTLSNSDQTWRTLSVNPAQTVLGLHQTLVFMAIFMLAIMLVTTAKRMIIVIVTLGVAGVFQVLYGSFLLTANASFSPIFDLPVPSKATGTFLLPEQYAYCVFVAICCMLGVLLITLQSRKTKTVRARFRRWIMYIFSPKGAIRLTIPILFVGLLLSQHVVIILTCSSSLVLVGLIAFKQFTLHSLRYRWFLGWLVAFNLITLSFGVNWALTDSEFKRHFSPDYGLQVVLAENERDRQSVIAVNDTKSPANFLSLLSVFGTGGGTVKDSHHSILKHWSGYLVNEQKSDWHQRIVEQGIVGALFYLGLLLLALRAAIYALYLETRASSNGIGFVCITVITGTLIISAFTHAMQGPANNALLAVVMALAYCADTITRKGAVQS
ncbi:hypothetical protein [Alteromonas ponticola]|uniref:O-antigen ligase domain-containing protein n=1 Tax=Alteromonas ponticola TaxID=2720613 RepID=A0ABX1R4V9_9ALTE|nr:hypothetical protein [Alteromonas ponticola]NMH60507.1 hypothetical protein [Alteromonas ponticola]